MALLNFLLHWTFEYMSLWGAIFIQTATQSITVGRSRQQELEAAGHNSSPIRKWAWMHVAAWLAFSTVQNPLPTIKPGLPASINVTKLISYRHVQRLISQVILDLIKLISEINYHSYYIKWTWDHPNCSPSREIHLFANLGQNQPVSFSNRIYKTLISDEI